MQKQKNNFLYLIFSKIAHPFHLSRFFFYKVAYYLQIRDRSFKCLLGFTSFYFLVLNFLEVIDFLLPLSEGMLIFLTLSLCCYIFLIGAFGIIFNRKNIIMLMVSVEVMFLGINLVFIFSFFINGAAIALIYSLIILSLAAAEAAIGFGLLVVSFRNRPNIEFKAFNRLKG